jgi:hypothetical protein
VVECTVRRSLAPVTRNPSSATTAVPIAAASDAMSGLRHFQTLLAVGDRLYAGADGRF